MNIMRRMRSRLPTPPFIGLTWMVASLARRSSCGGAEARCEGAMHWCGTGVRCKGAEVRRCGGAGRGAGVQGCRGADLQQLQLAHATQPPWHCRYHIDRQPRATVGAPYHLLVDHSHSGHVEAHACSHEDVSDEEHLRCTHMG